MMSPRCGRHRGGEGQRLGHLDVPHLCLRGAEDALLEVLDQVGVRLDDVGVGDDVQVERRLVHRLGEGGLVVVLA